MYSLDQIYSFLQHNPYIVSFISFIGVVVFLKILKSVILFRIKVWAKKTATDWDDAIIDAFSVINWPLYVVMGLYVATRPFSFPSSLDIGVYAFFLVTVVVYIVLALQELVVKIIATILKKRSEQNTINRTALAFLDMGIKIVLWSFAVIVVLQNLGYNVTALLGGLGVAGIGVGFALKNALTDFLSFFSIYFDKPFEIGDFIIIDNDMGTVEKIGLKTTRLRTLEGHQLIITNTELTQERINNYKRMKKRRVQFQFGVAYETPFKKVKQITTLVEDIFSQIENAKLDRVHLKNLGDYALVYEVVYYVLVSDYKVYMDIQQQVNFSLIETLEKNEIAFSYPTYNVFMKGKKA